MSLRGPDMSSASITERLRLASAMSNLLPSQRLDSKLDMSAKAVTARLREVSDLLSLCQALGGGATNRTHS